MKKIHITRLATVAGVTGALAVASFAFAADKAAPQAAATLSNARVKFVTASPEMIAKLGAEPVQGDAGMRAYVDAETKGLRAPTQSELDAAAPAARAAAPAAAKRSAAASVSAAPAAQKLSNGSSRLKLDESSLSYAVATIGPDGKLKQACVDNQPNQEAALRTATAAAAQQGADSHEK